MLRCSHARESSRWKFIKFAFIEETLVLGGLRSLAFAWWQLLLE